MQQITNEQFIRMRELLQRVGLSRSTVYRLTDAGRFPSPIKLSERASAWRLREVEAWAAERINASRTSEAA